MNMQQYESFLKNNKMALIAIKCAVYILYTVKRNMYAYNQYLVEVGYDLILARNIE